MQAQSDKRPVLIRVDVNPTIGTGHFMRCYSLARALSDIQRKPVFAFASSEKWTMDLLKNSRMQWHEYNCSPGSSADIRRTTELVFLLNPEWIVLDGYNFSKTYLKTIKETGVKVLLIEDCGDPGWEEADVVLNQNLYADTSFYPAHDDEVSLLLGPDYALLRREFSRHLRIARPVPSTAKHLLVTMGGSDPENRTKWILEALNLLDIEGLMVEVVAGGANKNVDVLREMCLSSKHHCELIVAPENMPDLMDRANLTISAGGTTIYELIFMRVPFLIMTIADNQKRNSRKLAAMGISKTISGTDLQGDASLILQTIIDPSIRTRMLECAKGLVDGLGTARVAAFLDGKKIRMRRARLSDSKILWKWANDAETRRQSLSATQISWNEHEQWFDSKLNLDSCHMFIVEDGNGQPVGSFRVDIEGDAGVVSVSIASKSRGKGYGVSAIIMGSWLISGYPHIRRLDAFVKTGNEASCNAFAKAGYSLVGETSVKGSRCLRFTLGIEGTNEEMTS